jgi:zinc protease
MTRLFGAALVTTFLLALIGPARAEDQEAQAILDKGIQALGGAEKLGKAETLTWKYKGTINFQGNENAMNGEVTVKGLDHLRRQFGNDQFDGVIVLAGDKGWRRFNENKSDMDDDAITNTKRTLYLEVVPITLVPLKDKGFKIGSSREETVNGKPAVALKVTGPDGKDFTLYLDKETGLPVKQVATVMGFGGQEFNQETIYADYRDFGGIKKATKIEIKRDGETFQKAEITEFKVLDKVDSKTFAEPE